MKTPVIILRSLSFGPGMSFLKLSCPRTLNSGVSLLGSVQYSHLPYVLSITWSMVEHPFSITIEGCWVSSWAFHASINAVVLHKGLICFSWSSGFPCCFYCDHPFTTIAVNCNSNIYKSVKHLWIFISSHLLCRWSDDTIAHYFHYHRFFYIRLGISFNINSKYVLLFFRFISTNC